MARILIIDDSETVRERVKDALGRSGLCDEFLLANDGLNGIKMLLNNEVDLVLCDVVMPGIDGFKFLKLRREKAEFHDVPVIMLSGQEHLTEKIRGFQAGASDYITKPFHDEELIARINVHLQIKHLQDQLRAKNVQLEKLTRTDPLTGLANRRHFMECLEREYRRTLRYGGPLSFVMADIDHFKSINDRHGHQVGDEALVVVAERLREGVREQDIVGRYGGEEFGLILPETQLTGAAVVAERCRLLIEKSPIQTGEATLSLSVSLGAAFCPHDRVDSIDVLIRLADDALFEAKAAGRNRLVLHEG
jgi:diguanylate cyclase (GGDEF)-like protein